MVILLVLLAAPCDAPADEQEASLCRLSRLDAGSGPPTDAVAAIFGRPGFEHARRRADGRLERWLAELRELVLSYFESAGAQRFSNATRLLVLATGLLVVAWAVTVRRRWRRAPPSVHPGSRAATGPAEAPGEHLGRAEALAPSAPREALREAWLALLAHLEASELVAPRRTRTNQEVARELAASSAGALAGAVELLARRFDEAFYSLEPVTTEGALRFIAEVRPLLGPERRP